MVGLLDIETYVMINVRPRPSDIQTVCLAPHYLHKLYSLALMSTQMCVKAFLHTPLILVGNTHTLPFVDENLPPLHKEHTTGECSLTFWKRIILFRLWNIFTGGFIPI